MSADLRIHAPAHSAPRPGGEFILYWIQTTHRAHDNFALNFAVEQADALGIPVLVYHGLRPDYPWASDRIHTFILEGVVDLARDFAQLGVQYAFHLDPGPDGAEPLVPARPTESPLVALARRAALVVTDYFPTFIVPRQTRALATRVDTPVVQVESGTVVPLRWVEQEHKTARGIRPVLQRGLPHFLHSPGTLIPRVRRTIELPFDPVLPASRRGRRGIPIPELVAALPIDHSVAPSPTLTGGTAAGRKRLAWFIEHGLPRYTEDRGDPNRDATSRLSAYLHFGHLSPHEVLLACRDAGPSHQYAKFEDEAVTWRELAHHFVSRDPKHRTVAAIPEWARQQLADHEADPREALYDDSTLEQGETHSPLWNAFQQRLVRDGELHNYARMLWGKSVIGWTENAARALRVLEHLNHKYALDGRDPASYGGILWCFGKFDRPFYRRAVFGTVRYMSLKAAEKKFDAGQYIRETREVRSEK
jgi:deoxyribodipyrimidine photo-lyase